MTTPTNAAPLPQMPRVLQPENHIVQSATPVPPGDTYYERLAAPLPEEFEPETKPPEGERRVIESAAEREARRLASRLPPGYVPTSAADLTFDPRIAYELALGVDTPTNVFTKYNVPMERARRMIASSVFIGTVKKYKEEITASGISFKLKAKIQAEDLLTHSYILATDPEVPAAVRADLIKWTAKMAGLEPDSKDKQGGGAGGGGFVLNITFAQPAPQPAGRLVGTSDVSDAEVLLTTTKGGS